MWVVAFMAALMLGTVMSVDSSVAEPETDDATSAEDEGMTPDPVVAIDAADVDTESSDEDDPADPDAEPSDEGDVTDEDEVEAPVRIPGQLIVNTGEETVLGSEGDDTLSPESFGEITIDTSSTDINLLGGNDVAELAFSSLFTTNIDGGDGNDTIDGTTSSPLLILGGAGNDELSSMSEGGIRGGEGNDTVSGDLTDIFDAGLFLAGGLGDDVIQVTTQIGADNTFAGSANLDGDGGMDRFELQLELVDTALVADGPTSIVSDTNIEVNDFDPSEDVLQLEITRPEGAEDRGEPVISLARDETGMATSDYFTDVTMTFAPTEAATEVISVFRVYSEEAITLDDIVLVEAADPAAAV